MLKRIITFLLSIFLILSLVACENNDSGTVVSADNTSDFSSVSNSDEIVEAEPVQSEVIFDVTQFANITSQQLIDLLGEPDNITQTNERGFTEIPFTLYDYESHELGFLRFDLINDSVVAISINGELPYNSGAVLETLNIEVSNSDYFSEGDMYKKWEYPTETIDLVHITIIDIEQDTYKSLTIEFDSQFYREWPLPLNTTEPGEYRVLTEDYVKSVLLSPKSADFPWFDWTYKKNDYYFWVESYVDAENAFGAEVRNYFTFVYFAGTNIIAYAVIDGEVIANNGYIETAEIVKGLVGNSSTQTPPNPSVDNSDNTPPISNPDVNESPNYQNDEDIVWDAVATFCNNYNSTSGAFDETLSWVILSPTEVDLYLSTEYTLDAGGLAEFDALGSQVLDDICSFVDVNYSFPEIVTFNLTLEYYEEEYYEEEYYEGADYEYEDNYYEDWEYTDEGI